jgi:hypothetical protein
MLIGPAAGSAAAQKPVNNFPPEVVGTPLVGERIVCASGSWSGSVSGFKYVWLRDAIPIAFGVSYNITFADQGHSLWCVVTAVGSEGNVEAESSNSLEIGGGQHTSPPENTVPPEVSGKAAVGEALSCSTGTWSASPAPAYTYQWVRDVGENETIIGAATTNTYKIASEDAGHSLACKVTATNSAGSASKLSRNSMRVPGLKPENKVQPQVLGIEPSGIGESLTCSPGTWSGAPPPTFAYQWLRDGTSIASATGKTYTVEPADELHSLSCAVVATNIAGSIAAVSANGIKIRGSRPVNKTPPHVSGTAAVGGALTCEEGTWSGVPPPSFAFLWVRDQGTPGEEAIASATASTYVVAEPDQGHSLSCEVTAANSEGSASQTSNPVVVKAGHGGSPPENEQAPVLSGTPALGQQLTCSEGTWSGRPVPRLAYQWLRDGLSIVLASANTYTVAEVDQGHSLSCQVTAINDEGVASAKSNALAIPGVPPQEIEPPQTRGTPAVGQQLICLHGKWSGQPPPALTYQWLRNGADIPAATELSYRVSSADRGTSISCRVTARNSAGKAEATSNSLEISGGRPQNIEAPEVSGTPAVGNTLTCLAGSWYGQPAPTYAYQWLLAGTPIPSATANTYTVVTAERGFSLACKVTASNREGSESATSQAVHIPGAKPEVIEAPSVSGTAAVLQQLTCARGTWTGAPPPTFAYQWLRDGMPIASATSGTYTVQPADQGHGLSCKVTATNSEGTAEAKSSNELAVVPPTARTESAPELTFPPSSAPSLTPAQVAAALKAQLARAQHHARISSLRKTGLYAVSVAVPTPGTLELLWYVAPPSARHAAKPLVVALGTMSFAGAGTKTVKLRFTSAGRRLLEHSSSLKLTLKGVFTRPKEPPVSWSKTVVLTY